MKNFFISAFFILLLSALDTQASSFVDRLNELDKHSDKMLAIKEALNTAKSDDRADALDWLQSKAFILDGDPRYGYSYAILLEKSGFKGSSAIAFLGAMLISRVDAARCADRSAPGKKIVEWESHPTLRKIFKDFKKMNKKEKQEVLSTARNMEMVTLGNRIPNEWLCSGGAAAIAEALKDPNVNVKEEDKKPGQLGKHYSVDVSKIKTRFISNEEWQKKRNEVLEKLSKQLLSQSIKE